MYVTIGNFFSTFFGALLWFFLATQMSASTYGGLNYYISIAAVFTAIGIMGFDSTLTTFIAKGVSKMRIESATVVLIAGIILSIVLFIIFNSFSLVLAFLGVLFFSMSTADLLGLHRYKEFMYLLIIERTISLISVPLLFWLGGIDGALYGYAISYLPLCYRFFNSLRKVDLSISSIIKIKSFFIHSYGLGLSKTFAYSSDKLLIMPIFGLELLGYYQFGIQMLTTLSIIPLILYNYLLPQYSGGKNKNLPELELYGIAISVVFTILMVIAMPLIIGKLFPTFHQAIVPTQLVLFAGIPLTVTAIYNSFFMAREKSVYVIAGATIFLASQFSLLLILGSIFGLLGLSAATFLASTIQSVFLFLMKRRMRTTSPIKKVDP